MKSTSCLCGHSIEEHGKDSFHRGSTACTECICIAFEADDNKQEDEDHERNSKAAKSRTSDRT